MSACEAGSVGVRRAHEAAWTMTVGEERLGDDVDAVGGVDGDVFELGIEGYGEGRGEGPGGGGPDDGVDVVFRPDAGSIAAGSLVSL